MDNILERAKAIVLKPVETWQVIKGEKVGINQLFFNYAAKLALIPAICGLIGLTIVGIRLPAGNLMRIPFLSVFMAQAAGYVVGLASLWIGAWIMKALAPKFGAKADLDLALVVMIYAMTPAWLIGVVTLIPGLAFLGLFALYAIYLLAKGLAIVLETPSDKVVLYTVSLLAISVLVNFVLNALLTSRFYAPMYMQMLSS